MLITIEACRAVAALLVVFFHAGVALSSEKYFGTSASSISSVFTFGGQAGVDFFFVLSGFIIAHVHWRDLDHPEKFLTYIRKRASRIYPAYVVIFLTVYLATLLTPSLRNNIPVDTTLLLKSLLLLPQDADIVGGTGAPVLVVAWSLQFEMVFYCVFAVGLLSRKGFYIIGALFLLNFLLQPMFGPFDFPRTFFTNHLFFLFAMGIFTAVTARSRIMLHKAGFIAAGAGLAFVFTGFVANLIGSERSTLGFDLAYGALSSIIVFTLTKFEFGRIRKLELAPIVALGNSSYALYLIHYPLISLLCKLLILILPRSNFAAWCAFVLVVAICAGAGLAFHFLVERPILLRLARSS